MDLFVICVSCHSVVSVHYSIVVTCSLSQTGSTLARTNLSPFARCTLGLKCHFIKNILCDHCLHDLGLYIQKILTKKEMINCQKFNFLLF